MLKRSFILPIFLLSLALITIQAQTERPAITADNAANLEEIGVIGRGLVADMAVSPDGTTLALGTPTGIWLHDVDNLAAPTRRLEGHTEIVLSLAFSADGRLLASSAEDDTIRIWDIATGETQHVLEGHSDAAMHVAFSPDGTQLASGGLDNTLRLWEVASGQPIGVYDELTSPIISTAFTEDNGRLVGLATDGDLPIWLPHIEVLTPARVGVSFDLQGHISPDGTLVAFTRALLGSNLSIESVFEEEERLSFRADDADIMSIEFSSDTSLIATGGSIQDPFIRIWNLSTGEQIAQLEGHTNTINTIAFTPDNTTIITSSFDGTLRVWDIATETQRDMIDTMGGIRDIAFTPDGQGIVTASVHPSVREWDIFSGQETTIYGGHTMPVDAVAALADTVVSGVQFGEIKMWNEQGETIIEATSNGENLIFSPNGEVVAYSTRANTVEVMQLAENEVIFTTANHKSKVVDIAFSLDSQYMATIGEEGVVWIWDLEAGEQLHSFRTHHEKQVYRIIFSPDNQLIASYSLDGTAQIWGWRTEESLLEIDVEALGFLDTNPALLMTYDFRMLTRLEKRAAFSPDQTLLALYNLQRVTIWDLEKGELVHDTPFLATILTDLAFSPDGSLLALSALDGTVRLWGIPTE